MSVTALMPFVVCAAKFARIGDPAGKIRSHNFIRKPRTSPVNINIVVAQYIQRARPHVTGQHHRHSDPLKYGGDIAFASATLRGWQCLFAEDVSVFADGVDCISCTMPEMIVYGIISRRNRYFHFFL